MRARHLVFHIQCFSCAICNQLLNKGDQFGIRGAAVYCRWVLPFFLHQTAVKYFQIHRRSYCEVLNYVQRFHHIAILSWRNAQTFPAFMILTSFFYFPAKLIIKTFLRFSLEGYILTSRLTRPHQAPSPAHIHHQILTVIHPTHHRVQASSRISTADSMALTVNTWVHRVPMPALSQAYRNSHDKKAARVNENLKISRQWQLI